MALSDIKPKFVDYAIGENIVRLYALTSSDAAYINERFGNEFFDRIKAGEGDNAADYALANPDLMACIIAASAHERTADENVKTLDMLTMIEMFTEVLKVTGTK